MSTRGGGDLFRHKAQGVYSTIGASPFQKLATQSSGGAFQQYGTTPVQESVGSR